MHRPDLKISIITVSYNACDTIEQTIRSVVSQTYNNIEYIIIDGMSTDGTVEIIKKYSDDIAYWCSEPDKGIYDAMNKGIQVATGDYIQIIGADDCLCSKDVIDRVVNNLGGDVDIFSAARYEVDEKRKIQLLTTNEKAKCLIKGRLPWMPHSGLFVKNTYMKANLFDCSYKIAADYKFILNAYLDKNVCFQYVDFPVVYFGRDGISSSPSKLLYEENDRLFYELQLGEKFSVKHSIMIGGNNIYKKIIKKILGKIKLLNYVLCRFYGWEKHQCTNDYCRWCGRV